MTPRRRRRSAPLTRSASFEQLESRNLLNADYHNLRFVAFSQQWNGTSVLTTANKWSLIQSVVGYRSVDTGAATGADPQTLLSSSTTEEVTVNPQTAVPTTTSAAGIYPIDGSIDVVGVKPNGTFLAPNLVFHVNTIDTNDVRVRYTLKHLNTIDAASKFALQYRIGETGNFINVPEGYVADASTAAGNATTTVDVLLPAEVNNQPKLQIRVITADTSENDSWIGIDDIIISANRRPSLNLGPDPAVFVEDGSPAPVFVGSTISDDNSTYANGAFQVENTNASENDRLVILHQGTGAGQIGIDGSDITYQGVTIGSFSGGFRNLPMFINLNSSATKAAVEALLWSIALNVEGENPATFNRTVSLILSDGRGGTSAPLVSSVQVVAVDDPPTMTFSNSPASAVQGGPAVVVDPTATFADVDQIVLLNAALGVTIESAQPGDLISFASQGNGPGEIGISGADVLYEGVPIGTLTGTANGPTVAFNVSATIAAVQQLLRSITFQTTSSVVGTRTLPVTFLGGDLTQASGQMQVTVSAPQVTASISGGTLLEGNAGSQTLLFAVSLSANPADTVTVHYQTVDATATSADGDYIATTGSLTFTPGGSLTQNIAIAIQGDNKYEPDEDFQVQITSITGATATNTIATGSIINDDPLPTLLLEPAATLETNAGSTPLAFLLRLSNLSYQPITVNYVSSDQTATTASGDYQSVSGSLVFAAGETEKPIVVLVTGDTQVEPDETLILTATSQGGTTNTTVEASGTITNDDLPPPPPSVAFGESGVAGDGLDPQSDSGVIGSPQTFTDRITNVTLPIFVGTSEVGATIKLYVDINGSGALDQGDLQVATTIVDIDGRWQAALTNPLSAGRQRLFVTATSALSVVSEPDTLDLVIDTQSPVISQLFVSSDPSYRLLAAPGFAVRPTPNVLELTLVVSDGPARGAGFPEAAIDTQHALVAGEYQLTGTRTGAVTIASLSFTSGPSGTTRILANVAQPLPDDHYQLTIDGLSDLAGNPLVPTSFTFTIDTRAEIAVWEVGQVMLDLDGNGVLGSNSPNGDLQYGLDPGAGTVLAGNFSLTSTTIANGFAKLATYTEANGQFRFRVDVDSDGVADNLLVPALGDVTPLDLGGMPMAGRFDANDANGDEVGVFVDGVWYFDTNHNFVIDSGDQTLATALSGVPVVGDFDGDGYDDLAIVSGTTMHFDLTNGTRGGWDGIADRSVDLFDVDDVVAVVAADMDGDGVDDVGLRTPSPSGGHWRFILSDYRAIVAAEVEAGAIGHRVVDRGGDALVFDLNRDLEYFFGSSTALPLAGNFNWTAVAQPGVLTGELTKFDKPLDVDGDTFITPGDVSALISALNTYGAGPLSSIYRTTDGPFIDVDGDGYLAPQDVLVLINHLLTVGAGEAARPSGESIDLVLTEHTQQPALEAAVWSLLYDWWFAEEDEDESTL